MVNWSVNSWREKCSIARAERDGTRATRLSPKRTSPFKSVGVSVQSTAGRWGARIIFSNAAYTMFGVGVRVLVSHSTRHFPLHFPSCASLCATNFRTSSSKWSQQNLKLICYLHRRTEVNHEYRIRKVCSKDISKKKQKY